MNEWIKKKKNRNRKRNKRKSKKSYRSCRKSLWKKMCYYSYLFAYMLNSNICLQCCISIYDNNNLSTSKSTSINTISLSICVLKMILLLLCYFGFCALHSSAYINISNMLTAPKHRSSSEGKFTDMKSAYRHLWCVYADSVSVFIRKRSSMMRY